jgi:Gamma interferon inducible lysosomal thiol reductase (GILT)
MRLVITSLAVLLAFTGCENDSKLDHMKGGVSTSTSSHATREVEHPAKLEFFVMSKCPYGVQVEKAIAPVLDKLGPNIDFHVAFIGQKKDDQLSSMHGPGEVTGDEAQLCAHEIAPDKYFKMIACQDADPSHVDTNWQTCGEQAGIDTGAIKACIDGRGSELLSASFDEASQRGATGSPTIFLNGKPYQGGRKSADFERAICNAFDGTKPAECSNIPVPVAVNAVFFSDARCAKCNIDDLEGRLGQMFDGLKVRKVDYMTPEGKALYAQLQQADATFKTLPAILFDSSLDDDKDGKAQIARYVHPAGSYQLLALGGKFDPTAEICDNKIDDDGNGKADCDDAACKDAMACRPEVKKSVDLFVMSHCPFGTKAMLATKEFADAFGKDATIAVHYIGDSDAGQLKSMHGNDEVTDDLREVCAIQHYSKDQKFLDFLACRSKDLKADWKACTGGATGIDAGVIDTCVAGEGPKLLTASFQVASKLEIQSSPTFMVNNRETFNAQDAAGIASSFCKANPGLAACDKQLSAAAPAQAPGGGGAACGTN